MPDKKLTPEQIKNNLRMVGNIPAWIDHRGLNQAAVAKMMGVSAPAMSKWLKGLTTMHNRQFVDIANIINVSPAELLGTPMNAEHSRAYGELAEAMSNLSAEQVAALTVVAKGLGGKL